MSFFRAKGLNYVHFSLEFQITNAETKYVFWTECCQAFPKFILPSISS